MIPFKTIELNDRQWIEQRLKESSFKGCEYSFANNFIWSKPNKIKFADVNGFYCLQSGKGGIYSYPAGSGDVKSAIEALMADAAEQGKEFILRGILLESKKLLEEIFPDKFVYERYRDECDYIYSVERLISLPGKKLHGKRNHIARFKDQPNWSYENITEQNLADCIEMNYEWCKIYNGTDDFSLDHEACAVMQAFKYFEKLKLHGGLLRVDGKVVAYTIGEPLTSDTYVVHIEKAFADIQGAYPMINQQFLINNCNGYIFVNREEDLGDAGLRKAKTSYYPDILLEKFTATVKKNEGCYD